MPDLFSEGWFANLESAISAITVGQKDESGLALGQVIHDTPAGTVSYTICLGAGEPGRLVRDAVDGAQVTLVEDFESAQAIHEGASVAELLALGKIKVRGDANALLRSTEELAALANALDHGI